MKRYAPWAVAGFGVLYFTLAAVPKGDPADAMHLHEFGRLPVVDRGRVKPLDTMARVNLMMISGRQTYRDEADRAQPAIKWLLEVMTSNPLFKERAGKAEDLKVFRIETEQVLLLLGLKERPGSFRYALSEFGSKRAEIMLLAERIENKEARKRDLFDTKLLQLAQQLQMFLNIQNWMSPYAVPPEAPGEDWMRLAQVWHEAREYGQDNKAGMAFIKILVTYAHRDVAEFNKALKEYRTQLELQQPDEFAKTGFETFFNGFAPFYACSVVYVMVFLLACIGWVAAPDTMQRSAFWLAVVALAVHTWALGARMYLTGRPLVFVTNLYSVTVFVGWMSVILSLVLERIYRNGLGNALAGAMGAASLVVAHYLGSDGDTLEMLQAVLDTNFWLATHVTTVTIGYSATLVAGFLGIAYVVWGLFTPHMDAQRSKAHTQMIYGIVCFAMLFSFVGTVLGGIWADQSWGRFWGWDPKENGALMIVLWNALVLHARWSGLIKQRGLAVLPIVGNMITGWSMLGTNQLGVGLHAYGFNNALALGLTVFWGTQIVCLGLGLVPLRYWRSFAPVQAVPAPVGLASPHVKPAPRDHRES
jgi:ABC-type transport system involved in cytochrome c biogenesis permease subunit